MPPALFPQTPLVPGQAGYAGTQQNFAQPSNVAKPNNFQQEQKFHQQQQQVRKLLFFFVNLQNVRFFFFRKFLAHGQLI